MSILMVETELVRQKNASVAARKPHVITTGFFPSLGFTSEKSEKKRPQKGRRMN